MNEPKPDRPSRKERKRLRREARRTPPGTAPGLLLADPGALPSSVRALAYGPAGQVEVDQPSLARFQELRRSHAVLWVQVRGLADLDLVRRLGEHFGLHRLALEDVVNVHQRAKYEQFEGHDFVVTRIAVADRHETEQVAMFVGEGFVLTFEERTESAFGLIEKRVLDGGGIIRRRGADYLAYAVLDAVVDSYFPELERIDAELDDLEQRLLDEDIKNDEVLPRLHQSRRWVQFVRRSVWPMREQVNAMLRTEEGQFTTEVQPYLRDVYDHVVQLVDLADNQRDLVGGLLDLHMSLVSQRLNEVMKLLTIIATIFIPLTFVAGIYGMNFEWMPELKFWWSYPAVMALMVVMVALMLRWFRRQGLL